MYTVMSKCIFLASLLMAVFMACGVSAQGGISSCCLKIRNTEVKQYNFYKLQSYYVQKKDVNCPLHAVVFTTIKKKRICSSPTSRQTQKAMAFVDGRNWALCGAKGNGSNKCMKDGFQ